MYIVGSNNEPIMEEIKKYFFRNGGFASMKELKEENFHTREIASMVKEGEIVKVKSGYYRYSDYDYFKSVNVSLLTVCRAEPQAVICLISALDYYQVTDFNPAEVYYAIPHSQKKKNIINPPVNVFYFRKRFYEPGIEIIKTKHGNLRIYCIEKTICDMFRYRNKLGEDLAMQALKTYLSKKNKSIAKLIEYAEICQVKTVILPIIKSYTT